VSRCQETAVAWADTLRAKAVCGVATAPDVPVDPRVNQTAAEQSLDLAQWTAAQQAAAIVYKDRAQLIWQALLEVLGFQVSAGSVCTPPGGPVPSDGLGRALFFLGLPLTTFLFATAVVMAFGTKRDAFKELASAGWPKPRTKTKDGKQLFRLASRLLGIILSVRYPKGYVANTMSTALARFFLEQRDDFAVACTHEEHMNFFLAALDLDWTSYARPTSALVFVPDHDERIKVFEVYNPVSRKGRVRRHAHHGFMGHIEVAQLQSLAAQSVLPVPDFLCRKL
jgi:hypothetical protein